RLAINMNKSLLNRHINSRASYLSLADYKDIMLYRDMKSKPLAQLSKKYKISNSRLYQIWRGQEFNRIQWNGLAVTPSTNVIDKQNEEHQAERDFQNKLDSASTALKNKIRDDKISKYTNPVSEESAD
ncbi:12179_t:CDS:1, partial [Dentiscutata erythropus]